MSPSGINIAIDGHSSTGKSTLAKSLARELGYRYIDTGAMYRAVTLYALNEKLISPNGEVDHGLVKRVENNVTLEFHFNKDRQRSEIFLNGENIEDEIREMKVAKHVSTVAAIPEIRRFLVKQQKAMAENKSVVMDGRDIGTVVLPNAELKIFMTASEEVRVGRRYKELSEKGQETSREEVAQNIRERDHKDSNRADSPLKRAEDAILLENSELSPEEQLQQVLLWVKEKV